MTKTRTVPHKTPLPNPKSPIIPETPVFAGAMKQRREAFGDEDGPDPLLPQCKKNAACYRADGHKGGCRRE